MKMNVADSIDDAISTSGIREFERYTPAANSELSKENIRKIWATVISFKRKTIESCAVLELELANLKHFTLIMDVKGVL